MSRFSARRYAAGALAVAAASAALLLSPSAASASTISNPTAPVVSPSTVTSSQQTFEVSGSGCFASPGGSAPSVVISSPDIEIGDGVAVEPDGTWRIERQWVPRQYAPGTYRLHLVCDDYISKTAYPVVTITLAGPTTAAPTTAAPTTAAPSTASVTVKRGVTVVTAAPGQSLTPASPAVPGRAYQLNLTGYTPGEKTTWTLHSTPRALGSYTADASGTLSTPLTIPADAEAGRHELWVTRADGSVVKYPVEVGGPELAYTGTSVAVPLSLGTGLVAVGAVLVVATRRRKAVADQA